MVSAVTFVLGTYGPGDPVRVMLGTKYDEDTAEEDDNGERTIEASNYLKINSLLTFILDIGEITENRGKSITTNNYTDE